MDSSVVYGRSVDPGLCIKVIFKLCFDVLNHSIPTVCVVDVVAKSWCVDDRQLESDTTCEVNIILLNISWVSI